MKLLVDTYSTEIIRARQVLCVLVYPSSNDPSSRTLRFLTGQLTGSGRPVGAQMMFRAYCTSACRITSSTNSS